MADRKRVLILCTENAARSPMAEGLLRHDAGDRFEVFSAGTQPSRVRPDVIAVMRELGIDVSGHRAKHVGEFAGQCFDFVLTVCDNAKESCPIFPWQGGYDSPQLRGSRGKARFGSGTDGPLSQGARRDSRLPADVCRWTRKGHPRTLRCSRKQAVTSGPPDMETHGSIPHRVNHSSALKNRGQSAVCIGCFRLTSPRRESRPPRGVAG
jgi:protein-tyrosine-phosphatase